MTISKLSFGAQIKGALSHGTLMGAALLAALLGATSPALALDRYGLSPQTCAAPPEGVIEVSGSSILIMETYYKRVGPKRDLGNGWFEATYQGEAEGEPIGTTKMRVYLTPAKIILEFEGHRLDMSACPR